MGCAGICVMGMGGDATGRRPLLVEARPAARLAETARPRPVPPRGRRSGGTRHHTLPYTLTQGGGERPHVGVGEGFRPRRDTTVQTGTARNDPADCERRQTPFFSRPLVEVRPLRGAVFRLVSCTVCCRPAPGAGSLVPPSPHSCCYCQSPTAVDLPPSPPPSPLLLPSPSFTHLSIHAVPTIVLAVIRAPSSEARDRVEATTAGRAAAAEAAAAGATGGLATPANGVGRTRPSRRRRRARRRRRRTRRRARRPGRDRLADALARQAPRHAHGRRARDGVDGARRRGAPLPAAPAATPTPPPPRPAHLVGRARRRRRRRRRVGARAAHAAAGTVLRARARRRARGGVHPAP